MKKFYKDINVPELLSELEDLSISEEGKQFKQLIEDATVIIHEYDMEIKCMKESLNDSETHIDQLKEKMKFVAHQYADLAAFVPEDY